MILSRVAILKPLPRNEDLRSPNPPPKINACALYAESKHAELTIGGEKDYYKGRRLVIGTGVYEYGRSLAFAGGNISHGRTLRPFV